MIDSFFCRIRGIRQMSVLLVALLATSLFLSGCSLESAGTSDNGNNSVDVQTEAWMEEREPIICLWKTNVPRGQYYNTNTSLASEILLYSDKQMREYISMLKYCGYTGIQVTDMCSTWAAYGGYEFVQERIRFMSEVAHSMDMNFTLWVWGAEFTGYGWVDNSVKYHDYDKSPYAYECDDVVASFDKYYSIYAELADCCDRVIMHFDDPSNIHDSSEVGYFARMFRDKFREINPDVKFGVSDYTDKFDKSILKEYLGDDFTIYCGANVEKDGTWNGSRTVARDLNIDLGVWSWNLCEMEIDQLAEMNVNANIIKTTYQRSKSEDVIKKPTYWSEMDSYHVLNIFSLYVAGKLLINPDLDENELLYEISQAVVGDKYAADLYEILLIIQDGRCGDSFESFKYGYDEYILLSDNYPFKDIFYRCEKYYPKLEEMIRSSEVTNTIPMPIEVSKLLSLIQSHVKQIWLFAEFRMGLDELNNQVANGLSKEKITTSINAIYSPISNYDCVIGVWGQPEALAQYKLLEQFCLENGIETPQNPVFLYYRKQYIYQEMICLQKSSDTKLTFPNTVSPVWEFIYGTETMSNITSLLLEDGLLTKDEEGLYLTDWENYIFMQH